MKRLVALALMSCVTVMTFAAGRPPVATFSKSDLARVMGSACGSAPQGAIHPHRNTNGNLLYLVCEDHREAVVYTDHATCNPLAKETLDVYRNEQGTACAQTIFKDEHRMLTVDQVELPRGKGFDVERSGEYIVVSQGASSVISAVSRPYRTIYKFDLDTQRLFNRGRTLLAVGGNKAGMLEARVLRAAQSGFSEDAPIPITNMAAGVKVLDYSEASDDLLLGGVNASGQTAFVIYNLASGQSSAVQAAKAGDDMAMFIADSGIRARLTGTAGGDAGGSGFPKFNWFR